MKRIMFDLNDHVEVLGNSMRGVIKDIFVREDSNTVYGLEVMGESELMYFVAADIDLI